MIATWLASDWVALQARRAAGRMPHALLIGGPAGLGKRAFAQALAASLLCSAPEGDGSACGRCRGCTLRTAGSHPDLHHLTFGTTADGEKLRTEITVDQLRRLGDALVQTSQFGGWRVAIIEPAEGMNASAANALLKTLEEPEPGAILILVSDRPGRLLPTIRSRCQRVDARFPPRADAARWLRERGLAADAVDSALDLAAGNPGQALALAEAELQALWRRVLEDLAGLGSGRSGPAEVANAWVKDRPAERLALTLESLRLAAWNRAGVGAPRRELAPLVGLTARVDFHKLAAWWDRANAARDLLRTPLRPELMVLEVLAGFRDLVAAGRGA